MMTSSDRAPAASRIRLLVSDIDGTLITPDKELTPATLAAAAKLRAAGITLCLASSRSVRGMQMFLGPLGIDTPAAGLNGGEIVAADGQVLEMLPLAEDAARLVVETLTTNHVECWLFTGREWVIRDIAGAFVPRERKAVRFEPTVVDSFEPFYSRIGKIMGASTDYPLLGRMEIELQTMLGGQVSAHLSSPWYLDVTHPQANKGHAALRLAALLGIDRSELACIGDMDNDISMLEAAGLGIAMGNAPEQVAASAHFVTGRNTEDGWAQAVEELILPRAPASPDTGAP
jgi:Cof subfamily protein (haloacid dehalogenase superfamily)